MRKDKLCCCVCTNRWLRTTDRVSSSPADDLIAAARNGDGAVQHSTGHCTAIRKCSQDTARGLRRSQEGIVALRKSLSGRRGNVVHARHRYGLRLHADHSRIRVHHIHAVRVGRRHDPGVTVRGHGRHCWVHGHRHSHVHRAGGDHRGSDSGRCPGGQAFHLVEGHLVLHRLMVGWRRQEWIGTGGLSSGPRNQGVQVDQIVGPAEEILWFFLLFRRVRCLARRGQRDTNGRHVERLLLLHRRWVWLRWEETERVVIAAGGHGLWRERFEWVELGWCRCSRLLAKTSKVR